MGRQDASRQGRPNYGTGQNNPSAGYSSGYAQPTYPQPSHPAQQTRQSGYEQPRNDGYGEYPPRYNPPSGFAPRQPSAPQQPEQPPQEKRNMPKFLERLRRGRLDDNN